MAEPTPMPTPTVEALESAQAAVWDAHYGNGIATEYARAVDKKARAALTLAKGDDDD